MLCPISGFDQRSIIEIDPTAQRSRPYRHNGYTKRSEKHDRQHKIEQPSQRASCFNGHSVAFCARMPPTLPQPLGHYDDQESPEGIMAKSANGVPAPSLVECRRPHNEGRSDKR